MRCCLFVAAVAGAHRRCLPFVTCLLIGCATPYQDMSFSGGVAAQQMTANTFRIVARGNGYTGATRVQDYLMLKAAETTLQNGGTHFVGISASDASGTSQIVTGGTSQTQFVGNTAYTTYSPPVVSNVFKPERRIHQGSQCAFRCAATAGRDLRIRDRAICWRASEEELAR